MSAPAGEQLVVNLEELRNVHQQLMELGRQFSEARQAAAEPTTNVQPPGQDPVSVTMAEVISAHGVQAQEVLTRGEQVHQNIVEELANAITRFEDGEHDARNIIAGNDFGGFGGPPQGDFDFPPRGFGNLPQGGFPPYVPPQGGSGNPPRGESLLDNYSDDEEL